MQQNHRPLRSSSSCWQNCNMVCWTCKQKKRKSEIEDVIADKSLPSYGYCLCKQCAMKIMVLACKALGDASSLEELGMDYEEALDLVWFGSDILIDDKHQPLCSKKKGENEGNDENV